MSISTQISADPITDLQSQINDDTSFVTALQESLTQAQQKGMELLSPYLYAALDQLYSGGWPVSPGDYVTYLMNFEKVIPGENRKIFFNPWKNNSSTLNGYSQEVYDRLCHFYFLVDQEIPSLANKTLQSYTSTINNFSFARWLIEFARSWGSFLNTKESLTFGTLESFRNDAEYDLEDYSDDAPKWKSFNTFFYRQLNSTQKDGSPMRPIANPNDNSVVCSPADCTFKAIYQIDASGNVLDSEGRPTQVRLKQTHTIGTVQQLLGPDAGTYAASFFNGTFVHYFLSPFDYHRFHAPVYGKVLYSGAVYGKVYLDVYVSKGQFEAPDNAEGGYEFHQARGVLVMDSGNTGNATIAVAPIGMCQVSSVHMYTQLQGETVDKGTEFGFFAFGGSDIIMLFPQPVSSLTVITGMANARDPLTYTDIPSFHFKYGQPSVIINGQSNRQK